MSNVQLIRWVINYLESVKNYTNDKTQKSINEFIIELHELIESKL